MTCNKNPVLLFAIVIALAISCNTKSPQQESTITSANTTTTFIDTGTTNLNSTDTTFIDRINEDQITTSGLIFPDNEKAMLQLLQTGKLNPDEVDKNAISKKWTGLFKIGNTYFLRNPTLEIIPTTDTTATGVKPVLMVNTSYFNTCVILVSGSVKFDDKNIKTVIREMDSIFPGDQLQLNLNNSTYTLSATGNLSKSKNGSFQISDYKLFLATDVKGVEKKQLLVAQPLLVNKMAPILWTGDMDGDGNLDLIIHASPNKGISTPALYLSSLATESELVKFAGQHIAR